MEALEHFLPQFGFHLALFCFYVVMLDGFDLGVGILSLTADSEERRGVLMTSLRTYLGCERNLVSRDGWRIVRCISYGTILTAYTFPIIMILWVHLRCVRVS